jgi:hypothetical protein
MWEWQEVQEVLRGGVNRLHNVSEQMRMLGCRLGIRMRIPDRCESTALRGPAVRKPGATVPGGPPVACDGSVFHAPQYAFRIPRTRAIPSFITVLELSKGHRQSHLLACLRRR